jgi:hypothetical protein
LNSLFRGTPFGFEGEFTVLREAWTIAIETLSWMELRRLNERSALARTTKQLGVNDPQAIRFAYGLIVETTRRKNLIDKLINTVVAPKKIVEYNQGVKRFCVSTFTRPESLKTGAKSTLKKPNQSRAWAAPF